jgi:DNA-binding transcriptional regulator YhcF (GntR family)
LEIKPGIGSVVSELGIATNAQRDKIFKDEVEKLVVECKRLSITKKEFIDAVNRNWKLDNEKGEE